MGVTYDKGATDDEFNFNDIEMHMNDILLDATNRLKRNLQDKLKVREFQFFFKSIKRPDRVRIIQSSKDIYDKVTKEELQKFNNKGWSFRLPKEVEDEDSIDYYRCLLFNPKLYHDYLLVNSTYEIDKDYDSLYSEISKEIEAGMELEEAREVAEIVRNRSFRQFDISVAHAASYDCLRSENLKYRREERVELNLMLWEGVISNKRNFWHVLRETYDKELHFYPHHRDQIEEDFNKFANRFAGHYNMKRQFEKFCDFVSSARSEANSDEKVENQELFAHAKEFAKKECVLGPTYSKYCKEKMKLARDLEMLKRGMDDMASSSVESPYADEFDVDDACIIETSLEEKLFVKEYHLFFKSRNQTNRVNSIRCVEDIDDNVTEAEMDQFNNKGWILNPFWPAKKLTLYQRLTFLDHDLYYRYQYSTNTYMGDQKYDEFYGALQQQLNRSMSELEAEEAAEALRRRSFPEIDVNVAFAGCKDWIERELEWRRKISNRTRLLLHIRDEVMYKNDFSEALQEIYEKHMGLYPSFRDSVEDDLKYRDGWGLLKELFDDLGAYVNAHSANWDDNHDIEQAVIEGYIDKCMDDYDKINMSYADHAKEKMHLGEQLGITGR